MIEIDGTALYQWDIGRRVVVTGIEVEQVHFANKGDSRAVIMGAVDIHAQIPDFLLQSGKQLCVYAVKDGITVESKVFYVNKRERPEHYVYEDDQRNYLYELIVNAENAVENAEIAADKANAAAEDAEVIIKAAENAANTADESALRAEKAAISATQASTMATEAAGNAHVATENATNAAASASEFATDARTAASNANAAAKNANTATQNANDATASATLAATNANTAAKSANDAAEYANKSADKALHTAKSLMVVGKVEGTHIYLDDAIDQFLVGMRIFGKTTQAGTPSPDRPVSLVSVGDRGLIIVNVVGDDDVNLMSIDTTGGLPGIPVSSGGNYTDADGQQWICDEIDLARGVYVQRCLKQVFDGSEKWQLAERDESLEKVGVFYAPMAQIGDGTAAICNRYQQISTKIAFITAAGKFDTRHSQIRVNAGGYGTTVDEWKQLLGEWYADGNPLYGLFALTTPIETPLPEQVLADFASMKTHRGSTTINSDASAHMAIEYVMDAKKYIDSQVHPAARITSVSLPASEWAGSDNLYSQVVSIDGITENSQVNLAPSVEQMAIFYEKDITFVTENDGGVVTVYVIGQKPQNDYTIQADIAEVIV